MNILDKNTGDSAGIIAHTTGVHGIAFDNAAGKGFTSNGRLNNVTVFDLKTSHVLAHIPAGENPDAILYEPFSKKIITCNGGSKDLSIIDPGNEKPIITVPVGGKPEAAVSDGQGRLFVNIEDRDEIVVVNTKTFRVVNHWSLLPGQAPTGLALDNRTRTLFAGCRNLLVVMNANNGTITTTLPIGKGCDGVAFDSTRKIVFASNGEGNLTIIQEGAPGSYRVVRTLVTKKGARTIALDEATHRLYLPTADFKPAPGDNRGEARPKPVSGSFQVLVLQ